MTWAGGDTGRSRRVLTRRRYLAEKDRPIFQAAVACGATHLLTGDLKDFGTFMNQPEKTFGVRVQTVADFLESLLD